MTPGELVLVQDSSTAPDGFAQNDKGQSYWIEYVKFLLKTVGGNAIIPCNDVFAGYPRQ
jgi:hypothetical protein